MCQEYFIFSLCFKSIILYVSAVCQLCFAVWKQNLNYQISYFSLLDKSMFLVRETRFCKQQSKVLNLCLSSGVDVQPRFSDEHLQYPSGSKKLSPKRGMLAQENTSLAISFQLEHDGMHHTTWSLSNPLRLFQKWKLLNYGHRNEQ